LKSKEKDFELEISSFELDGLHFALGQKATEKRRVARSAALLQND
jgi:hypothetical protein